MATVYLKLFYDFLGAIEPLTMEERGRLLTAMLIYAEGGEVPDELLAGGVRYLFPMCRQRIDRDGAAYARRVEANRTNGAKGGRPRKNPMGFQETEKRQDKEKDEDKDKEKDKDEDKDKHRGNPRGRAGALTPACERICPLERDDVPNEGHESDAGNHCIAQRHGTRIGRAFPSHTSRHLFHGALDNGAHGRPYQANAPPCIDPPATDKRQWAGGEAPPLRHPLPTVPSKLPSGWTLLPE